MTLALENIHLKIDSTNIRTLLSSYESKRSSTELSNFIWGKEKEKINVDIDWSILDTAKPYSPASKNACCVLY